MKLLIKSAKIVCKEHSLNGKITDILIENGVITSIGSNLENNEAQIFTADNLHVSIGWMDMRAKFCDPGFEHREDLKSGIKAAAKGGFTAVALMPSTNPPIHSKSQVEYIVKNTQGAITQVYPMGCVSHNREGKDLAEMYDMKLAGAVAFTDDKRPIEHAGLLLRALQYNKIFNGLVINFAEDKSIAGNGIVNEGITATKLGLKSIPSIAEEIMIERDIAIAEYADAPLHFTCISSAKSVDIIEKAQHKGLKITADVAAHNLYFDDTVLESFDSNYKVKPPFRTNTDIASLIEGIKKGVISVICSDHTPLEVEMKDREFDHAGFGIIALQTAFATANESLKNKINLDDWITTITSNPRKILNIEIPEIKVGAKANLTLFNPDLTWELKEEDIVSKSKNSPFIGKKLTGKALAIINKNQFQTC